MPSHLSDDGKFDILILYNDDIKTSGHPVCLLQSLYEDDPQYTVYHASLTVSRDDAYDFPKIVHHIGRILGLQTNDDDNSIMGPNIVSTNLNNSSLNDNDIRRVNSLYFIKEQTKKFLNY